jgi:hypothetical protein
MTEISAVPGFAEQEKTAAAFIGTILNSGADPMLMLKAQTDLLDGVGTAMTDWLQRQHEAVVDAQRLIAQVQAVSNPAEMLKAQQEWVVGVFQRMNADANAYQASAMQLVEKWTHWVGRSVEMTNGTPQLPVNSRAAGPKPVSVAPKAR